MTPAMSGSKQTASNLRCAKSACVSYVLFAESITVGAVLSGDGSGYGYGSGGRYGQAEGFVGNLHGWWRSYVGHCG
jgi:hypothetical protein